MSIAAPTPTPTVTYAGLDVAKATLALHLAGQQHDLPNTPAGHARLVRLLKKQPGVRLVCEASGGYEQGPTRAQGRRAKNDPIDAEVLAEFGAAVRPRRRRGPWLNASRRWSSAAASSSKPW